MPKLTSPRLLIRWRTGSVGAHGRFAIVALIVIVAICADLLPKGRALAEMVSADVTRAF